MTRAIDKLADWLIRLYIGKREPQPQLTRAECADGRHSQGIVFWPDGSASMLGRN